MKKFEKDSDQEVWKYLYTKLYTKNHISETFDIQNYEIDEKAKRFIACDKQERKYFVGGETDFNFSKKIGQHRQSKYSIYRSILETISDVKLKKQSIDLLDFCSETTSSVINFSLMLSQGSMQSLKGVISNDRFDVYLFLVDEYLRGNNELIFGHCSYGYINYLKKYFCLFNHDIYEFCENIYFISDKNLVHTLINSGKRMLDSPERVIEYMSLAVRYWNEKDKYYRKKNIYQNEKEDCFKFNEDDYKLLKNYFNNESQ